MFCMNRALICHQNFLILFTYIAEVEGNEFSSDQAMRRSIRHRVDLQDKFSEKITDLPHLFQDMT